MPLLNDSGFTTHSVTTQNHKQTECGGGGEELGLFWAGGEISDVKFVVSGFLFLISVFSLLVPGSGFCGFWYLISVF